MHTMNKLYSQNSLQKKVLERIKSAGIKPNEELGQHFLIDGQIINLLAQSVTPGNTVIEIGAGVGQLTDSLAEKATALVAVEIDRRYQPVLSEVEKEHPNARIIYGDALALNYQNFIPKKKAKKDDQGGIQVIASLAYHITEPFLHRLVGLPLESTTLVVGQRLARAIQAKYEIDPDFGQLTLLAQTFFDIEILAEVDKRKFFPVPRTDSAVVRLTPKEEEGFRSNRRNFFFRRLFLTSNKSPLVKNALREGLIEYKKLTKNQARAIINQMGILETILEKPFEQLNNNQLRILSKLLRE